MKGKFIAIALIVLLIVSSFTSCSLDNAAVSKDETVRAILDTSASRGLEVDNGSYSKIANEELYWVYKAEKKDSLYATGTTNGFVDLNDGAKGFPENNIIATFSKGAWEFTFKAYKTQKVEGGTYNETDLYYDGIATSVTLDKDNWFVRVNVKLKEAEGTTGTINIKSVTCDNTATLAGEAYDVYVQLDSGTMNKDTDKAALTTTGYTITDVPVGMHTVSVYFTKVGDHDFIISRGTTQSFIVSPNLTNTVHGSIAELTVDGTIDAGNIVSDTTTFKNALTNANSGDIILVKAGEYDFEDEIVTITKPLQIIGEYGATNFSFTGDGQLKIADTVENGDVTIDGITINGTLYVQGGGSNSIKIKNSTITNVILDKEITDATTQQPPRLELTNAISKTVTISKAAIIEADKNSNIKTTEVKADLTLKGTETKLEEVIVTKEENVEAPVIKADSTDAPEKMPEDITVQEKTETGEVVEKTYVAVISTSGYYENIISAFDAATDGDTITLLADYTHSEVLASNYVFEEDPLTIDLNGKNLSLTFARGSNLLVSKTGNLTIKNGTLNVSKENGTEVTEGVFGIGEHGNKSVVDDFDSLTKNGELTLEDVVYTSNTSALCPAGKSKLTVKNSEVYAKLYPISTNNTYGPGFDITVDSSTIQTTWEGEGEGTGILINNAGTLSVSNSKISAGRQVIVVRGGTATVTDCDLILTESKLQDKYLDTAWGGGNEIPQGIFVVGSDKSSVYQAEAKLTLVGKNTMTVPDDYTKDEIYLMGRDDYASSLDITGATDFNYDVCVNLESANSTAKINDYVYAIGNYSISSASSYAELKAVLKDTTVDVIVLTDDIDDVGATIVVNRTVILDANNKTVSNPEIIWSNNAKDWSLFSVREDGNLTVKGNGTFKALYGDCYAFDVKGTKDAELTIENGTAIGNISAVYVYQGRAIIQGGTYSIQDTDSNGYNLVINCNNDVSAAGNAIIQVTGGRFHNYNPATKDNGDNVVPLAAGYESTPDGDYYVVTKK